MDLETAREAIPHKRNVFLAEENDWPGEIATKTSRSEIVLGIMYLVEGPSTIIPTACGKRPRVEKMNMIFQILFVHYAPFGADTLIMSFLLSYLTDVHVG